MIDVSQGIEHIFILCSCGVITGIGMYFSQAFISVIPRLFVLIANS